MPLHDSDRRKLQEMWQFHKNRPLRTNRRQRQTGTGEMPIFGLFRTPTDGIPRGEFEPNFAECKPVTLHDAPISTTGRASLVDFDYPETIFNRYLEDIPGDTIIEATRDPWGIWWAHFDWVLEVGFSLNAVLATNSSSASADIEEVRIGIQPPNIANPITVNNARADASATFIFHGAIDARGIARYDFEARAFWIENMECP